MHILPGQELFIKIQDVTISSSSATHIATTFLKSAWDLIPPIFLFKHHTHGLNFRSFLIGLLQLLVKRLYIGMHRISFAFAVLLSVRGGRLVQNLNLGVVVINISSTVHQVEIIHLKSFGVTSNKGMSAGDFCWIDRAESKSITNYVLAKLIKSGPLDDLAEHSVEELLELVKFELVSACLFVSN